MTRDVRLRHSVAPRVLDGSLSTRGAASHAHHSVRLAAPPDGVVGGGEHGAGPMLTTFVWKQGGNRVQLAGSWDGWRKHSMTYAAAAGTHVLVVELPPAAYFYRFVVDGRWRVAEGDDVQQDPQGEMSHHVVVSADASGSSASNRKSVAVVRAPGAPDEGATAIDVGASDTESDASDVTEPLPPRQRGAGFVEDYDDDVNGEFDLQADVHEAIRDVAEKTDIPASVSPEKPKPVPQRRKKPGRRMMARVLAVLFAQPVRVEEDEEEEAPAPPTRNQKMHALAQKARGLRVWFPSEKGGKAGEEDDAQPTAGRKLDDEEKAAIIDANDTAMRLHQAEENAESRQQLGKTLFAQGKYDAALALYSLAVKLREDNGLKNSRTNAVAHTDVASAFLHIGDYRNADKHLRTALGIFERATFSGGRVQLADVHCFLGVCNDMRGRLKDAELAYRNAIDIYERARATGDENPNFQTAVDNLKANGRRQKQVEQAGGDVNNANPEAEQPAEAVLDPQIDEQQQQQIKSPKKRPPPPQQQQLSPPPPPPAARTQQQTQPTSPQRPPQRTARSRHIPPPPPPQRTPERKARAPPAPPNEPVRPPPEAHGPVAASVPEPEPEPSRGSWVAIAAQSRASKQRTSGSARATEEEEGDGGGGGFEDMCRQWHAEGRRLLAAGKCKEAMEQYKLALYTRKTQGGWDTGRNARTLVEHARACFGARALGDAIGSLRNAVNVLEKLGDEHLVELGETSSSLGSVLDRLGKAHVDEARSAHVAAMVALGRAGVDTEDRRWDKAWRSLCAHLDAHEDAPSPEHIWGIVESAINQVQYD